MMLIILIVAGNNTSIMSKKIMDGILIIYALPTILLMLIIAGVLIPFELIKEGINKRKNG
jgi:hypothetical protein